MNSDKLSPFMMEMKKRGFTYVKDEDHFINNKGVTAVEISDPDKPLVYGYNVMIDDKKFESVYFEVPLVG